MKILLIIAVLLGAFGIFHGIIAPAYIISKEKRCTLEVLAEIVEIKEDVKRGAKVFFPVYEINIDGKKVRGTTAIYTQRRPMLGQRQSLFVNPDNHGEFYKLDEHDKLLLAFRAFGFAFVDLAALLVLAAAVVRAL